MRNGALVIYPKEILEKVSPGRSWRAIGHSEMAALTLTLTKFSPYPMLSRRDAVSFSCSFAGKLNPFRAAKSVSRVPAMFSPSKAFSSSNLSGLSSNLLDLLRASPATWESSIASNLFIFTIGSPLLLSGLSASGLESAFLLGVLTWRAFEAAGFFLVATYFVVGTAVTKLKLAQKEALGLAEKRMGRRGLGSVIGSSAAGFACALLSIYNLGGSAFSGIWRLAFVASFCTKLSDTVSSEIGKAYGKTAYLVTTFKVVSHGTEGAVSVEGTIAGLLASVLLSAVGYFIGEVDASQAAICILSSQIANLGESYIGAAFQEKEGFRWLNNDAVNVLNIFIGSFLAVLIQLLICYSWRC